MRRRSTFILDRSTDFDPDSIKITKDRFFIPEIKAAREEQLKYSLDELPEELQHVLVNAQELHIRWSPEHRFDTVAPYLSRIAPGLHLFYTPATTGHNDLICLTLQKVFSPDLKCVSPGTTFIKPDILESEFKTTPALQYHSVLPNLDHLITYVQRTLCPHSSLSCIQSTSLLSIADTFDISWSAITSTFTVSAFWSRPPGSLIDPTSQHKTCEAWSLNVEESSTSRVEVGILSPEDASPSSDLHDLTLSGFLAVVGTDDALKPTRFSFPARHHALASQLYTASITQPQGLHPTLRIMLPKPLTSLPSHLSQCTLQVHLTLPLHTFVDPYSLKPSDSSFVDTYHITSINSHSGYMDLEAPDYLPNTPWGSTLLFTPSLPPSSHHKSAETALWEITVPLHLRYLPPSSNPTNSSSIPAHDSVTIPYPHLYYACPAPADTAAKFPISPFDRLHLGYDASYGPLTSFWHLDPSPISGDGKLTLPLSVPVLASAAGGWMSSYGIEVVTLATILFGFLWIFIKLWPGLKAELKSNIPETTATTEASLEWREPIKGPLEMGLPGQGVRRRA